MLAALLADLTRLPDIVVESTWSAHLPQRALAGHVHQSASPAEEARLFETLAVAADAVLVIAPETNGVLEQRTRYVETLGCRLLGSTAVGVARAADKLLLATHWSAANVSTPCTHSLRLVAPTACDCPLVIKPRDGAGSQNTFVVDDPEQLGPLLNRLARAGSSGPDIDNLIWQPWIAGTPISVALLFDDCGQLAEVWPVARQHLSDNQRCLYLGGAIPAEVPDPQRIVDVACRAAGCVPGLRGYVGVDLVLPADASLPPQAIEINPRLTTSYLGYRRLAESNPAASLLDPGKHPPRWRTARVHFTPDA